MGDVECEGSCECVEAKNIWDFSTFAQFGCQPKIALRNKIYKPQTKKKYLQIIYDKELISRIK